MNRAQRRAAPVSKSRTWTISDAYNACPFRTLVSLVPGTRTELFDRVGAVFAAVDGDVCPIEPDRLAELIDTLLAGRTVIVMGNRTDLRDAAKAQLMAAGSAAFHGAAGSA